MDENTKDNELDPTQDMAGSIPEDDPPESAEATIDDGNVEDDASVEDADTENEGSGMTFIGHLDELRKRIIFSLIGIVVGMIVSGFFVNFIVEKLILNPALQNQLQLQNLKPFGQPVLYFKIIFVAGIVLSIPFTVYQLWRFIAPGLYKNERKWGLWMTISATFSFLVGIAFAYFVMLPLMVAFAAQFGSRDIQNIIDVNEYLSFFTTLMIGSGLVFELPVLSFILAQFGAVNSKFLQKYWRHAMVLILVISAVITPTPDPVNQLVFAIPLFLLYEISVLVVKRVEKRKAKKGAKQNEE